VTRVPAPDHQLGDVDPLDSRLAEVQGLPGARAPRWWLRHRLALGLSPTPSPALILLPLGLALGPSGLNLLSPAAITYLDPVVYVTIAALGVFVGLGLNLRRPDEGRLLAAASLEAGLTILLVGAGVLVADALWLNTGPAAWMFALTIGLCASASATATGPSTDVPSLPTRIGDLDDVLPILVGGLALAYLRGVSPAGTVSMAIAFAAIAAAIATAGWLLVRQATSESEQHVFVAGTLLLLGGAAAYLSQSALFAGLLAGMLWNAAGGPARDRIGRDMRYLQHPLIVLLVLVAGARFAPSRQVLGLALAYLICRIVGKLAGGWMVGRVLAPLAVRNLGISLVPPGVVGIAFALNVLLAERASDRGLTLLAIVLLGSVASELLSFVARAREHAA
jgi:hypothetical protein